MVRRSQRTQQAGYFRLFKGVMMSKKSEQKHLNLVALLPCCLCGSRGVEVHHILEGRVKGRKSGHFTAIPLCPSCHRGSHGIHGNQSMMKVYKKTELELLGETIERLYG